MGAAISLPDKMSFDGAGLTAAPGEGVPRRLKAAEPPPTTCKFGADIDNIYSIFSRSAGLYPNNPCFGTRTEAGFDWVTYADVLTQVHDVRPSLPSVLALCHEHRPC